MGAWLLISASWYKAHGQKKEGGMELTVYLSGEIHTDWRAELAEACDGLDIHFTATPMR
jgi:hypothetical protein